MSKNNFFIILLSLPFFSAFANPCKEIADELNKVSSSLNQKYELKEKLKKILEDTVEREVVLQAEGVLAPPEREKAKNIAQTQAKLERVIKNQEENYRVKKIQFCDKCLGEKSALQAYCSFCAEKCQ